MELGKNLGRGLERRRFGRRGQGRKGLPLGTGVAVEGGVALTEVWRGGSSQLEPSPWEPVFDWKLPQKGLERGKSFKKGKGRIGDGGRGRRNGGVARGIEVVLGRLGLSGEIEIGEGVQKGVQKGS